MTFREYEKNNYAKCPICGSEEISIERPAFGEGEASVKVNCECGSSWIEEFSEIFEQNECDGKNEGDSGHEVEFEIGNSSGNTCTQEVLCECGNSWLNEYEMCDIEILKVRKL